LLLAAWCCSSEAQEGNRYALLVGVDAYPQAGTRELPSAERDAEELRDFLKAGGFKTRLLTTKEGKADPKKAPTKENIEASLARMLDPANKLDVALVALIGRGVDQHFCPSDGDFKMKANLLPLGDLAQRLQSSTAKAKVLLVDAVQQPGSQADSLRLPEKASDFLAVTRFVASESNPGGRSVAAQVMKGLRGPAAKANGEVNCETLAAFLEGPESRTDGFTARVLSVGAKPPTALFKAVRGPELEWFSTNAFSVLGPKGWARETGGRSSFEWMEFKSGGALIMVRNDSAGVADIIAGPNRGVKMKDPKKEVVHSVHLQKREVFEEDYDDYREEEPVPFDCKAGMGRWSAFSGTNGEVQKIKIRGVRATIQSSTHTFVIRCICPEAEWNVSKPMFVKIVTSLSPGKGKGE
jgi:hypothetical protein